MTYRKRRFPAEREGHWHGHCHRDGHGHDDRPERGRRGPRGRRFGSREELITALEGYQRNLEERAADVAEKIRRLRAREAEDSAGVESPEGADATPTTHNV